MPPAFRWKAVPEDFRVAERATLPYGDGPFAWYAVEKRGLGTPEALAALCAALGVPAAAAFAGLKDAQAVATQHVSVLDGPQRDGETAGVSWRFLGGKPRPVERADLLGNEFALTLRALSPAARERLPALAADLPALPNYFDTQRFGSRGESGAFVAAALCGGRFEDALWLALAEPNRRDRPPARRNKALLAERWGDWPELSRRLPPPAGRAAAALSRRPDDWLGALRTVGAWQLGIFASAFQSWLWNAWLSARLRSLLGAAEGTLLPLPIERDTVAAPAAGCPVEWLAEALPYPSARNPPPDPAALALLQPALDAVGLGWDRLRIDQPRAACLPKGGRALAFRPSAASCRVAGDAATLRFFLPRGSYATIVLAWLAARCAERPAPVP